MRRPLDGVTEVARPLCACAKDKGKANQRDGSREGGGGGGMRRPAVLLSGRPLLSEKRGRPFQPHSRSRPTSRQRTDSKSYSQRTSDMLDPHLGRCRVLCMFLPPRALPTLTPFFPPPASAHAFFPSSVRSYGRTPTSLPPALPEPASPAVRARISGRGWRRKVVPRRRGLDEREVGRPAARCWGEGKRARDGAAPRTGQRQGERQRARALEGTCKGSSDAPRERVKEGLDDRLGPRRQDETLPRPGLVDVDSRKRWPRTRIVRP